MTETIVNFILGFLAGNPHLAVLLTIMSVARMIFKPACSIIQTYVDATPDESDNKKWKELQEGKTFKAIAYAFDFLLSIKIPGKK